MWAKAFYCFQQTIPADSLCLHLTHGVRVVYSTAHKARV